jgi:hypothetical protein
MDRASIRRGHPSQLRSQHADDIVRRNHSGQLIVVVDDRQSHQIIFIEKFRHFILSRIRMAGD